MSQFKLIARIGSFVIGLFAIIAGIYGAWIIIDDRYAHSEELKNNKLETIKTFKVFRSTNEIRFTELKIKDLQFELAIFDQIEKDRPLTSSEIIQKQLVLKRLETFTLYQDKLLRERIK